MFLRCCIVSIAALITLTSCNKPSVAGGAIKVNGRIITHAEIMQSADILRESILALSPEKAIEGVSTELLSAAAHQLIANQLLVEEAKKSGFIAKPSAVDSAYQQLRGRFSDQASFERELTKAGETDSSFRTKIVDGLYIQLLLTSLLATSHTITPDDCKAFYEQNKQAFKGKNRFRASQIFLPFTDSMKQTAKNQIIDKANRIRQQIIDGKSFADCAKVNSRGPGALDGGDIGWFAKGDLRPDLDTPLTSLKKGELSPVVITSIGAHLLQKTDEDSGSFQPFDAMEKNIRLQLELQERNKRISQHIDTLIQRAKITYLDESLKMKSGIGGYDLFSNPTKD